MMRVGLGFDVHAFDASRPLVLGGVTIAGAPGLAGWSDADVVSHAIVDALLGAAGLGDIGAYFPKEAVAEGVSSQDLLAEVARLVAAAGYRIGNIDATVVVQEVRIGSHRAVGILPEYCCRELLADRRLRATLLPRRRDVWLLVQNHLKRDPAARAVIDWVRDCFQEISRG